MNVAQIHSRLERLEALNKKLTAKEFAMEAYGELPSGEAERRKEARLEEIAALDIGSKAYEEAVRKEIRAEARKKKRMRWHRYSQGYFRSFPSYDIDWTKAQKAVMIALLAASEGKVSFRVAIDWIAKKADASRSTVKRTIRRMEAEGLLSHREYRHSAKRNEWNEYIIECSKLLRFAKRKFLGEGFNNELHYGPIKGNVTTEQQEGTQSTIEQPEENKCRSKAGRMMVERKTADIDPETFELVAKAALEEIGEPVNRKATQAEIMKTVLEMRDKKQPNFNQFFWEKGVREHGAMRTSLAFLQIWVLSRIRKLEENDDRPWNERKTIGNKDAYLYGILKKPPHECRPEITLGAILQAKEIYDLPKSLTEGLNLHEKRRKGLKRCDDSGQRLFASSAA